jgi:hypothetical protein
VSLTPAVMVVLPASTVPTALAADDDWVTSIAVLPGVAPAPDDTLVMPNGLAPVAIANVEAVVMVAVVDATVPTERRLCACARRSTLNTSAPVVAVLETLTLAAVAFDTVALKRLNVDASASLLAAVRNDSRSVLILVSAFDASRAAVWRDCSTVNGRRSICISWLTMLLTSIPPSCMIASVSFVRPHVESGAGEPAPDIVV